MAKRRNSSQPSLNQTKTTTAKSEENKEGEDGQKKWKSYNESYADYYMGGAIRKPGTTLPSYKTPEESAAAKQA